ncbi:MAG TPA: M56 family metallopeptidase, partial [Opitutaceae bacterium]|nr:M56 family metallopeptidase [Opitutaceae bacterium]
MHPIPALLTDHLWQSSVAGLALLALLLLSRALSARTRRALAWLGLAQLAVPAAPLLGWLWSKLPTGAPTLSAAVPVLPGEWLRPVVVLAAAPAHRPELWNWAAGAWAAGFAGLFGLWLLRGWRFRRSLLATAEPPSGQTAAAIAAAARRLGLRRPLSCREAGSDFGPGVLGWIRPVVILPRGLRDGLTAEEFDAIVIHELIHVRRRDSLLSLLQALLISAFWFNPVAWLLHRALREETERSCDESVLAVTADPDSYASGILKALRYSLGASAPAFAGALTLPVASRLKAILAYERRSEHRLWRWAALAAGFALAAFSGRAGSISG